MKSLIVKLKQCEILLSNEIAKVGHYNYYFNGTTSDVTDGCETKIKHLIELIETDKKKNKYLRCEMKIFSDFYDNCIV